MLWFELLNYASKFFKRSFGSQHKQNIMSVIDHD